MTAREWATAYWQANPPAPLSPEQDRAVLLFGQVTPRPQAVTLRAA